MNWNGGDWVETPGMRTGVPAWGTTFAVDTLDPSFTFTLFSHYFHNLIQALVAVGYTENTTIVSAGYDWRAVPDKAWAEKTRVLVEKAVAAAGGLPAVIVGHSMGAPRSYYFLMQQTAEWRAKYIHHVIQVSPAWMGAGKSFDTLWEGYDFGLPIDGRFFAPLTRRVPSDWFLLPQSAAFPQGHTMLQTPSRNWTLDDLPELFETMGVADAAKKIAFARAALAPWGNSYDEAPGVPVSSFYTTGHKTTLTLVISEDAKKHAPDEGWPRATRVYGDGDGTVNIESLLYPTKKWESMGNDVTYHQYTGYGHVKLLTSKTVIKDIVNEVCKN